ncbi:MAG TPA: hypothetical protein VFY40_05500, partial [Blastocatellia bacterium]|nr:hypothetical protein [Blastocatellia bacterium]
NSYGWVDKSAGIAHIPIDRAKDLIADKGLLELPSPAIIDEIQNAERVRKEINTSGSNAGRVIKVTGESRQPLQPAVPQPAQPAQQNQQQVPPQQH